MPDGPITHTHTHTHTHTRQIIKYTRVTLSRKAKNSGENEFYVNGVLSGFTGETALFELKSGMFHTAPTVHNGHFFVAQAGWNNVPLPILDRVFNEMTAGERWRLRSLGSCWASAVRSAVPFDISVSTNMENVKENLLAISLRQERYPGSVFIVRVKEQLLASECHEVLQTVSKVVGGCYLELPFGLLDGVFAQVASAFVSSATACWFEMLMTFVPMQGSSLPSCQLELCMAISDAEPEPQLGRSASAIATISGWLRHKGVVVSVSMCQVPGQKYLPASGTFKQLAPFLQSVDFHAVVDLEHANMAFVDGCRCFTASQVMALASGGQSLKTLCVSDHVDQRHDQLDLKNAIPAIVTLSNLTKLHLTFGSPRDRQPDFRLLQQLNCLEDLALQTGGLNSDCTGVIDSNRLSLQRVHLTSHTWSTDTYIAIKQVATLTAATFVVSRFSDAAAFHVGSLTQASSIHILVNDCEGMTDQAFVLLSSGGAKITVMSLKHMHGEQMCSALREMPSLRALTLYQPIFEDHWYALGELAVQPSLTRLSLMSCFDISQNVLQRLIEGLPALQLLSFLQELHVSLLYYHLTFSMSSLMELTKARNLRFLNLEGVQGLSDEMILALESCFQAQQRAGQAQQSVQLQLPDKLGTRGIVLSIDSMHFPYSFRTDGKPFIMDVPNWPEMNAWRLEAISGRTNTADPLIEAENIAAKRTILRVITIAITNRLLSSLICRILLH